MSKFFFVRHGQSEGNAGGYIATPDTKLTDLGIEQARTTGLELRNKGITKIVCSPMARAQQTAEVIAAELGIDLKHIEIIEELHERRLGELEGNPREHEPEWYMTTEVVAPDAETRDETIERLQICIKKLATLAEDETLLAVGHGIIGYYLGEIAEGKKDFNDFGAPGLMKNASYIEIDTTHHTMHVIEDFTN